MEQEAIIKDIFSTEKSCTALEDHVKKIPSSNFIPDSKLTSKTSDFEMRDDVK